MANVKLLRQSLDDFQRDVATANRDYGEAYDAYAADFNAQLANNPDAAPTAVAPGQWQPDQPNITTGNLREMQNPGLSPAQLALQSGFGKSKLAGENAPLMRNSVFANPDDPKGLKNLGILARVMGGQL